MPSHISSDKRAKVKGMERQMTRDAMRQYATANKLTMAQVRAHAPSGLPDKARERAEKKKS